MLDGFSIAGYRSFGPTEVKIPDLARVNVFIGKNNCGKSNILGFVARIAGVAKSGQRAQLDQALDCCYGTANQAISLGLQLKKNGYSSSSFAKMEEVFRKASPNLAGRLGESLWFHYRLELSGESRPDIGQLEALLKARVRVPESEALAHAVASLRGGDVDGRFRAIAIGLYRYAPPTPNVNFIDAFRRIGKDGQNKLSGAGLIAELRRLQSPEHKIYSKSRERFLRIENFIKSVLCEPAVRLEIPAETDDVYVVIKDKILPLDSLGTGIHELVILSAAITLVDDAVFCIEEPEIHCHPELQKKFLRYAVENTKNQYLIASHSNAFLDMPGTNAYRCWLDDAGYTRCELVSAAGDKHALLLDLGYRLSDLLQTNYVVWVEGPSDRIYIKHWIQAKAPELVEGLNYTIMFYGGRLLSHVRYESRPAGTEAADGEVADFVELAHLNRSACIVIDSDKSSSETEISATKKRIVREFGDSGCLVWLTDGRTIENYLPEALLQQAVAHVHPKSGDSQPWMRFGDLTKLAGGKMIDKVAVAKRVVETPADVTMLDLEVRLDSLIESIRRYNT